MKYQGLGLLCLVLLLCSIPPALAASAWEGRVLRVSDGDSLHVAKGGERIRVRLYGIDSPELQQAYGPAAQHFAQAEVFKKKVRVEPVELDRYGRTVALVFYGDKLLNRELIRAGYAWTYPRYCTKEALCSEFRDLENKARSKRQGLWQEKNPQAPWDWRRLQRTARSKK